MDSWRGGQPPCDRSDRGTTESQIHAFVPGSDAGDWFSLRQLGWGLQDYAGHNDGMLPERLEDFESLDGYHPRWTYFPGFSFDDPPGTILIASSHPFSKADGTKLVGDGQHRMVLSLDGRRFILKEADYQAYIKEQQQAGWTSAKAKDTTKDVWHFLSDPAWQADALRVVEKEHEPIEIPELIHSLKNGDFFSAMELLGEIGADAQSAIPILRINLTGAAKFDAAWALWRIDAGLSEAVTPVLASFMGTSIPQPHRLDQVAQNYWLTRFEINSEEFLYDYPVSSRMAALGALWQMHPGKREQLSLLLVPLLREWERSKVLNELTPATRTLIPALEDFSEKSPRPDLRILAMEVLQKVRTTDPGEW